MVQRFSQLPAEFRSFPLTPPHQRFAQVLGAQLNKMTQQPDCTIVFSCSFFSSCFRELTPKALDPDITIVQFSERRLKPGKFFREDTEGLAPTLFEQFQSV